MLSGAGIDGKDSEVSAVARDIIDLANIAENLKMTMRHSWLSNGRQESVAEHSWCVALLAVVVSPLLRDGVDTERLLKMVVIHDLAEALTGDIPAQELAESEDLRISKHRDEEHAIRRVLALLPDRISADLLKIWDEFEAGETQCAKVALALDKLEAQIQHNEADPQTWTAAERQLMQGLTRYTDFEPLLRQLGRLAVADGEAMFPDESDARCEGDLEVGTNRRYWNEMYARPLKEVPWEVEDVPLTIKTAIDHLGFSSGAQALDLGCGSGRFSRYMSERKLSVTGVDCSRIALEIARAEQIGSDRIQYVEGDILQLEEILPAEKKFAFILDFSLTHHLSPNAFKKHAAQCARLLTKNGKLLMVCFSPDDPLANGARSARGHFGNAMWFRTKEEVIEAYPSLSLIHVQDTTLGKRANHPAYAFYFERRS